MDNSNTLFYHILLYDSTLVITGNLIFRLYIDVQIPMHIASPYTLQQCIYLGCGDGWYIESRERLVVIIWYIVGIQ